MKYLIYGAGTIGLTYAWLLSSSHDIDILVKPECIDAMTHHTSLSVKDLRTNMSSYQTVDTHFHFITEVRDSYDGILVTVNRCQLKTILPHLSHLKTHTRYFVFMQNNWNLRHEISPYIESHRYLIAFPSTVGGGRQQSHVEAIIFDEATRIGGPDDSVTNDFKNSLQSAGIKTELDPNIYDWLKVHYLQQSITAGAVLENGDFLTFAKDYPSIKKMVLAFREGIKVCRCSGVPTNKIFPANLFRLPLFIVAHTMQTIFLDHNTQEMVSNHMKKGLPEWIAGYQEILQEGQSYGLPMTIWKSYAPSVETYLNITKE